jgi:hypothetical protein
MVLYIVLTNIIIISGVSYLFNHYFNAGYCNDYVYAAVGTINADGNVEHTITPLMAY